MKVKFSRFQLRSSRGGVMVEASIALPMFFLLIIVGVDLLILSYTALSLQYVASVTAREASLANMSNDQVVDRAVREASVFGVSVDRNSGVYMCPVRTYSSCGNLSSGFNQGEGGELVALRVDAAYNSFIIGIIAERLSKSRFRINRTVVMRREPND